MKRIFILILILVTMPLCALAYDEADSRYVDYYNNAVTLFKAQKYSSAIVEFKKVLRYKPYEAQVKNALISAYLARGEYFANQANESKKAINDLKSALFYLKYWDNDNMTDKQASIVSTVSKSLKGLEGAISAQARLENAKILRATGELQAAGYDYNQLLSNSSYQKIAYENLGDIYKTLNNQLDSINSYRNAIKLDPKNAMLHFKYAILMDEVGNVPAAGDEYNLALKYGEKNSELLNRLEELWLARTIENPTDAQAFINLGTVLQKKGDFEQAKIQYTKALALDSSDKTAALNLASLFSENKNYAEAINLYDKLLAKNPKDVDILAYKASAYENLKDYTSAHSIYEQILLIDPNNKIAKEAYDDIARNHFSGDKLLSYLETRAKNNPNDFSAQYELAYQNHKAGNIDKAVGYYEKALSLNAKDINSYVNLIQIYTSKNDFVTGEKYLAKALAISPNNADLLAFRDTITKNQSADLYKNATDFWEKKNYKEALNLYLKIPIQTPEVLSSIASCYFELNDYQNAINYYKKVLQKIPNDTNALYIIATSYLELNNEEQAKIYLNKLLALEPENASAKNALDLIAKSAVSAKLNSAISFYEQKNYLKAMVTLDEILKIEPQNAYAYYYKGIIYDEQNKKTEAIAQFMRVIKFDPNFTLAYYSLANLYDTQEKYNDAINYYNKFIALKKKDGTIKDEYGVYVQSRVAELTKYLNSVKK